MYHELGEFLAQAFHESLHIGGFPHPCLGSVALELGEVFREGTVELPDSPEGAAGSAYLVWVPECSV